MAGEINKTFPFMEFPLSISRQGDFPIDRKSLWWDKAEADNFAATDPTAYIGMPVSVYDEAAGTVILYIINKDKQLQQVGKPVKVDGKSLERLADGETLEIKGFKSVKKAGLVLRTKAGTNGGFEVEWAETKDGTVDDLATRMQKVEETLPKKSDVGHGHKATEITEDTTHKFVTDVQIAAWDAKATPELVDEKIAAIPVATNKVNGLMSSAMVQGHEALAQDMAEAKKTITDIKDNGNINYHIASATKLGAVKIGANINVTEDGTISTHAPYQLPSTLPGSMITEDATHRWTTDVEKQGWADKYTKAEVDNKFNTLESNTMWKESVATFADIAKKYPTPKDGWTVNVNDTDITYRYTGSEWIKISANAIPMATQSVDGKMSKEDKKKLDGIAENANNYVHPEHHAPSIITQDADNRFVTDAQITKWDGGVTTAEAAKTKAEQNAASITQINQTIEQLKADTTLMTTVEAQAIIDKYKNKQ